MGAVGTEPKWICVVFGYSDLFHLVSRGYTRRNLWARIRTQAGLIGRPLLPGSALACSRRPVEGCATEQITATKLDSIVPA